MSQDVLVLEEKYVTRDEQGCCEGRIKPAAQFTAALSPLYEPYQGSKQFAKSLFCEFPGAGCALFEDFPPHQPYPSGSIQPIGTKEGNAQATSCVS